MKNKYLILILICLFLLPFGIDARQGCCSWHGGVCGCQCCDGTPLSSTCAPYYPGCSSGTYYTTPTYSTPTTSCPLFSYEDLSGNCKCMTGYIADKDLFGNPKCVSGISYCHDSYGYNSTYNSTSKTCECNYGYVFKDNKCISRNDYCEDLYGYNSEYSILTDGCACQSGYELSKTLFGDLECKRCSSIYGSNSEYNYLTKKCECKNGYTLKDGKCETEQTNYSPPLSSLVNYISCPSNATLKSDEKCYCNDGFEVLNNKCATYTEICKQAYGGSVYGKKEADSKIMCYCESGNSWDADEKNCIKSTTPTSTDENILYNNPSSLDNLLKDKSRDVNEENKYSNLIALDSAEFKVVLNDTNRANITNFVTYGISDKTIALGAGERRALVRDYFETVGRSNIEWADMERLVNGEKIVNRNLEKEQSQVTAALKIFKKIFKHDPVFSNQTEDLAWNTLLYRIRFPRDLDKEKAGITKFKKIFYYSPQTPMDWAAVRVLGYVIKQ